MTTPAETVQAHHLIVITLDDEMVKTARDDGEIVSPLDREFWNIQVHCHADKNDFTRPCVTWFECECSLTGEQRDELFRDGEGPCPESPNGVHQDAIGDLSPARPSQQCWAQVCDSASEAVYELADRHKLGPGKYRVHLFTSDYESIEFKLDGGAT